jgi:ATP-dependent DNA helicase RecG
LARKLYAAIGQKGVHTRRTGLDRDTHKALILKHLKINGPEGAKLAELWQILPFLSRSVMQKLLTEMKEADLIFTAGATKSARWYIKKA